jgi:hypothetical protein
MTALGAAIIRRPQRTERPRVQQPAVAEHLAA